MKKVVLMLVFSLFVVPSFVFGFDTKTIQIEKSTKPIPYCIMAEGYPKEGHYAVIYVSASSDNGSQEVINITNTIIGAYLKQNFYKETPLSYIYVGKLDLPAGTIPVGVFIHKNDVMNIDKINEAKEAFKESKRKMFSGCPESDKIWEKATNNCTYYVRYRVSEEKNKEAETAIIINGSNNCTAEKLEEEANRIKEFMINYARQQSK